MRMSAVADWCEVFDVTIKSATMMPGVVLFGTKPCIVRFPGSKDSHASPAGKLRSAEKSVGVMSDFATVWEK